MGVKTLEVPTYNCTYCGFEAMQLNKIAGQDGGERLICGECMIRAFDKGLGYTPEVAPEVTEPKVVEKVSEPLSI